MFVSHDLLSPPLLAGIRDLLGTQPKLLDPLDDAQANML